MAPILGDKSGWSRYPSSGRGQNGGVGQDIPTAMKIAHDLLPRSLNLVFIVDISSKYCDKPVKLVALFDACEKVIKNSS